MPFLLLLAILLGVGIRVATFQNFINPEGGFYFYNVDSYDHLRRVTLGVYSFPAVPSFDSYAAYPKGLGQIWSPLYDYILSAVCRLLGGSRVVIETVCFFSNPFYAALTIILIFFVARKAFSSEAGGIAAAFLLAINPGHISSSIPMNFGHHVFESIAILFLFALAFFEKNDRLPLTGKLIATFILVLAIFMWRGSTIYWGITILVVFVRCVVSHNRKLSLDYAVTFAGASVAVAAYCALDPWGTARGFNFGIISWFHVTVLALCSVMLLLYSLATKHTTFLYYIAGVVLTAAASLSFPPVRRLFSEIATGIVFLRGGGDAWLNANSEMHGVFSGHNFFFSASYLSVAWFVVPAGAVLAFLKWEKGGKTDKYLIALAVWSPVVLLGLTLRYAMIAGVIASLSGGYLFSLAWRRWKDAKERTWLVAIAILLLIPSYPHYRETLTLELPPHVKYGLLGRSGVLNWIRDNTPQTSYYLEPSRRPEYGVLASWDIGAQIYQVARRPAMATAFGWEAGGFFQQNSFMATTNQEAALAIAKQNGIRYLVMSAFIKFDSLYAIALEGEKRGGLPPGTTGVYNPGRSVYERLMYHNGTGYMAPDGLVSALRNYRLIFETDYSEETPARGIVNYYKVFEVVPGAILRGKAMPNSRVFISLPLVTSAKQMMYFQDAATADSNGNFSFTVPYSTDTLQGGTLPLGGYALSQGMQGREVNVTERDVKEGRIVSVR